MDTKKPLKNIALVTDEDTIRDIAYAYFLELDIVINKEGEVYVKGDLEPGEEPTLLSDYVTKNDDTYEEGNREYMVLTEDEANEKCKTYIEDMVWSFNPNFIIQHSNLPYEAVEMVKAFQEAKSEGANDTLKALINDMDEFVEDAINTDGRGHHLSSYDGTENEVFIPGLDKFYYIYRTN